MSSRGSRATNGHVTTHEYSTKEIMPSDAKVLEGNNGIHSLPDYSHTPSSVYVKLKENGELHEMRFYNKDGKVEFEIAHHPEPNINNGNRVENVLHYHIYDGLKRSKAKPITKEIKEKYKKYLEEFYLYD